MIWLDFRFGFRFHQFRIFIAKLSLNAGPILGVTRGSRVFWLHSFFLYVDYNSRRVVSTLVASRPSSQSYPHEFVSGRTADLLKYFNRIYSDRFLKDFWHLLFGVIITYEQKIVQLNFLEWLVITSEPLQKLGKMGVVRVHEEENQALGNFV